jgi:ABC-type nitrate/sulfonate/bicarbonate transport system substrate-binding protein
MDLKKRTDADCASGAERRPRPERSPLQGVDAYGGACRADTVGEPGFGARGRRFYQAVVDGAYAKYGLDVTILPGGPQTNGGLLLVAGKIEFFMIGDMLGDFLEVEQGIPTIPVAAEFQKNPEIMMSHPGVGLDKWTDLPKATAYLSQGAVTSFYAWMSIAWGFKDENVRPYTFNSGPFIADKYSIQQGYVTSEPFEVEKQGGFKPNIFLLADYGYSSYPTLIETRRDLVQKNPDRVQASSTRRRSVGTIVSTAITRRPTRRSSATIRR